MISIKQYYTAPSQEVFDDIKQAAIRVWQTYYFESPDYADGKINSIKDLQNIGDNYAHMVAMFDIFNQLKLKDLLNTEQAKILVGEITN